MVSCSQEPSTTVTVAVAACLLMKKTRGTATDPSERWLVENEQNEQDVKQYEMQWRG